MKSLYLSRDLPALLFQGKFRKVILGMLSVVSMRVLSPESLTTVPAYATLLGTVWLVAGVLGKLTAGRELSSHSRFLDESLTRKAREMFPLIGDAGAPSLRKASGSEKTKPRA